MTLAVILEKKHNGAEAIWGIDSEAELISMAQKTEGFYFDEYTMEKSLYIHGGREEIPADELKLLDTDVKLVMWGYGHDDHYVGLAKDLNEYELAQEALFHDLDKHYVLGSEEDANWFLEHGKEFSAMAHEAVRESVFG